MEQPDQEYPRIRLTPGFFDQNADFLENKPKKHLTLKRITSYLIHPCGKWERMLQPMVVGFPQVELLIF
jgi:hypothetical protein